MRIISPFRDYYDGVQGLGFDDKVVYTREKDQALLVNHRDYRGDKSAKDDDIDARPSIHTKLPILSYINPPRDRSRGKWQQRIGTHFCPWKGGEDSEVTRGILYFCGKAYPFYLAYDKNEGAVFSHQAGFDELVVQKESTLWWSRQSTADITPFRPWLKENMGKEIDPAIHFFHKSPIVLFIGQTRIVNPCLKDFEFQRVIDSYTAFQELDMFMSGVMGDLKDPPSPMTDVEKVVSHGMDPKWSFRKPPASA